jgi:hypothetical protein
VRSTFRFTWRIATPMMSRAATLNFPVVPPQPLDSSCGWYGVAKLQRFGQAIIQILINGIPSNQAVDSFRLAGIGVVTKESHNTDARGVVTFDLPRGHYIWSFASVRWQSVPFEGVGPDWGDIHNGGFQIHGNPFRPFDVTINLLPSF